VEWSASRWCSGRFGEVECLRPDGCLPLALPSALLPLLALLLLLQPPSKERSDAECTLALVFIMSLRGLGGWSPPRSVLSLPLLLMLLMLLLLLGLRQGCWSVGIRRDFSTRLAVEYAERVGEDWANAEYSEAAYGEPG